MHSILITGASSGIGRALAHELAAPGRRLLLTGRNPERLTETAKGLPGDVATVSVDLLSAADRSRLLDIAVNRDVIMLINNAGLGAFGRLTDANDALIEPLFAANVLAPIQLTRDLIPHFHNRPGARIVNIGSTFGSIGFPGQSLYCASKFALRGFSEALRRELAETGIRVQYIAPRATRTGLNTAAVDTLNTALGNHSDTPEWVARQIVRSLHGSAGERYLGWPEKLFVRLNAIVPGLLDRYFRRHHTVIERALEGEGS